MRTALRDDNPVLFIENVRLYGRRAEVDSTADADPVRLGPDRARGLRRHGRRALAGWSTRRWRPPIASPSGGSRSR